MDCRRLYTKYDIREKLNYNKNSNCVNPVNFMQRAVEIFFFNFLTKYIRNLYKTWLLILNNTVKIINQQKPAECKILFDMI